MADATPLAVAEVACWIVRPATALEARMAHEGFRQWADLVSAWARAREPGGVDFTLVGCQVNAGAAANIITFTQVNFNVGHAVCLCRNFTA